MDKRIRQIILFLVIYGFLFLIGFKSGEAYHRMKNRLGFEKIDVTREAFPKRYYIVETRDFGTYSDTTFNEVGDDDTVIRFYQNENLKPLLKLRKLSIYNLKGERIY